MTLRRHTYDFLIWISKPNPRSRFPIVRDELLHQFCIRTAVGTAILAIIIRTTESRVETITVHICSGNDPNHGEGLGKYQDEKNVAALNGVFSSSKHEVKTVSISAKKTLINMPMNFLLLFKHWVLST